MYTVQYSLGEPYKYEKQFQRMPGGLSPKIPHRQEVLRTRVSMKNCVWFIFAVSFHYYRKKEVCPFWCRAHELLSLLLEVICKRLVLISSSRLLLPTEYIRKIDHTGKYWKRLWDSSAVHTNRFCCNAILLVCKLFHWYRQCNVYVTIVEEVLKTKNDTSMI